MANAVWDGGGSRRRIAIHQCLAHFYLFTAGDKIKIPLQG